MTMLADALRLRIETWSDALLRNSRLAVRARGGTLSARDLALYLVSLRYLLVHSQANLRRAVERCRELDLPEVARYFEDKVTEEHGHERWADDDLAQLATSTRAGIEPASAIVELVALQTTLLTHHPVCFVAYSLWAELMTARIGDGWLSALESSGFGRQQVTAIDKHLEADQAHAAHALDEIDRLWQGEPAASTIIAGITDASVIFERFCDEIADASRHVA